MSTQVIVIVADGARPDTIARAISGGSAPALAQLAAEGGMHTVTSVFPSVTGPAYTPFLMGRHPASVGLPGLRWYDRARTTSRLPGHSRSYVGYEVMFVDGDLYSGSPTIFELVPDSIAALSVVRRGLARGAQVAGGIRYTARGTFTHFSGNPHRWLDADRIIAEQVVLRVRRDRPRFTFGALPGIDKASHARGQSSSLTSQALRTVDETIAQLRAHAERAGSWNDTHLWVVSDHGHSDVTQHEDLAGWYRASGFRTIAHPWVYSRAPQVAVMVSGNAMAHVYLELDRRTRPYWVGLSERWSESVGALLSRQSVDLLLLPHSPQSCEVRSASRGTALVTWTSDRVSYFPATGDPLGIDEQREITLDRSHDVTVRSDYPDSLVQIARLAGSARSGDVILSASPGWDFRAKWEPIPHVSAHGALHRDHMLVPLITNKPVARAPLRTTDLMPSALAALRVAAPTCFEGRSFL